MKYLKDPHPESTQIPRFSIPAVVFLSFLLCHLYGGGEPAAIKVRPDGTGDVTTIQEGVDLAREGQTVLVFPGVYHEAVWVRKNIRILGKEQSLCRLYAPEGAAAALTVMDLAESDTPLSIEHLTFSGDRLHKKIQDLGFDLIRQEGRVVTFRIIEGGAAEAAGVQRGIILDKIDGWFLEFPEMVNFLVACNGERNSFTLEFDAGPYAKPKRLLSAPRVVPGKWPKGVAVINSRARIRHCRFENSGGNGLWVGGERAKCLAEFNEFIGNRGGGAVYSYGAAGCLRDNRFLENLHGIVVEKYAIPLVTRNMCRKNEAFGILYREGGGGFALKNECRNNDLDGILSSDPETHPTLNENICLGNGRDGIRFEKGGSGTGNYNTCWKNDGDGIHALEEGTNCYLYKNQCRRNRGSGIRIEMEATAICDENESEGNEEFAILVTNHENAPLLRCNRNSGNLKGTIRYTDTKLLKKR